MRGRRRRKRAGRIFLTGLLFLLVSGISVGTAAIIWIGINTKDRSGTITGPVIFAQSEQIWDACVEAALDQERKLAAAEKEQSGQQKAEEDPGDTREPEASTESSELSDTENPADLRNAPKLRIVLDPGHGGPGLTDEQELGAIYRDTYEKYLTLEIARAMGEELSEYGNVEVFLTRNSDQALTLKERAAYAESVGADLLVSLHLNASLEHNFYGSEVFVSAFERFHALGAGVGNSILEELTDYGFVSKGVKTRLGSKGADYYGIIRECKALGIPALIVEHGYMDEDSDWSRMSSPEARQALGRRDAAGLAAYFGLEKGVIQAGLPVRNEQIPTAVVRPDTTPPEEVWYQKELQRDGRYLITLHGVDRESRVMYYDYSLDGGQTYSPLKLWAGEDVTQFPLSLTGTEQLVFRVYNNYELRTAVEEG